MILRLLITLLLVVGACGQPDDAHTPVPAKAVRTASPATPPSATAPVEAPAAAKENSEPKRTVTAPTPPPPPADPVDRFVQALSAIVDCDRADDGLLLADPTTCLKPVSAAREQLIHPSSELAATQKAREALRTRMAAELQALLGHEEPTVIYYTLAEHAPYFRATPETLEALDTHMDKLLEPIAEAATVARLGLADAPAGEKKKKALEIFDAHIHRRVRHAACRHLGSSSYKGNVDIFKRLVRMAKDTKADLLLRSCAAKEAGHVATNRQLKALTALLALTDIQQAVIVGLQRGLGTPKAMDAYVRWFEKHATKPDAIHWTSMHVFLPWDSELNKLPQERATRVLTRIAEHTGHLVQVRTLAIEGLKRLKADDALKAVAKSVAPDDAPEVHQALGR